MIRLSLIALSLMSVACGSEEVSETKNGSSLGQNTLGESCGKASDCASGLTCGRNYTCYDPKPQNSPLAPGGTRGSTQPTESVRGISPSPDPAAMAKPGPKVDIGELIINLKEPTGDRYLKVVLELELDSEKTVSEVEGRLNAIKYELSLLLSGQRVRDVQGPAAIETLRKAMIRRANSRLAVGRIVNVWPSEWIIQ